jgi:hypothetical protein
MGPDELAAFKLVASALLMAYVEVCETPTCVATQLHACLAFAPCMLQHASMQPVASVYACANCSQLADMRDSKWRAGLLPGLCNLHGTERQAVCPAWAELLLLLLLLLLPS